MPYAVLVSVLGAIVSAAIALFGFRSWAALTVAPIIGGPLGLLFAIFSLRRHDLPLRSTLEAYRSAAGVSEALERYLKSALSVGLIVACIELPSIMLGQDTALTICVAGCTIVLGGTIYRSWRLTNSPVRLDVFQVAGGIGCLVIFGWMGYVFTTEIRPWTFDRTIPLIDLAKIIFVLNGVAALLSAVLACFALAIASSLSAATDDLER
ncbi:hypothetical protein [Bradyrhizobium acaciae]|uniref:hypothetical protein n=1 Tax=Bradyrhizobium acaciae TaxID=2683706 RepID=UPI001E645FEF|nr:hypothetical protein [Bradyrhizobium acaciae]MCC8978182.1 hypothetical protein [Bradyrhizobium acaciae]